MDQFKIQCLTTYEEFCAIKSDWEEFTSRYFPLNYSRTFPWLAAWWRTYHNQNKVQLYIQRNKEGKIVSAAPLLTKWEVYGGFPVRMLLLIGNGLGTDDFLVTDDGKGFVTEVFKEIGKTKWHVARLGRVANKSFFNDLLEVAQKTGCNCVCSESFDFFIQLPPSYAEYLQLRSRRFRRNLNHAEKLLCKMGTVEFVVLDPFKDAARVQEVGNEIARTSWQYKEGLSHFNQRDGGTLYSNLTHFEQGAGGEDFNLLLVDGRPVAYLLGCRRDRIYYAIDTAFHDDFRNVSAGRILYGRIIERLIIEQQVDILDFEGAGEYKDHYANNKVRVNSLSIYNNSLYSSLVHSFKNSRFYAYLKQRKSKTLASVDADESNSIIKE